MTIRIYKRCELCVHFSLCPLCSGCFLYHKALKVYQKEHKVKNWYKLADSHLIKFKKMKQLLFLFFLLQLTCISYAQTSSDTVAVKENSVASDDPSQFFTRVELFNELQHYNNNKDFYVNQTTLRTIVKLGKRFTTRLDVPFVYNSFSSVSGYRHSGIGDISFRLLGYKIIDNPKSAITASVEVSLNTAQSPLLGTGKNLLIPVVSYTHVIPKQKMLVALVLQQVNAVGGDKTRSNVSFSKIQAIALKTWSKRTWSYLAPEWYVDYVHGGLSMNLKGRFVYAPAPRINLWATAGAGIFGDFIGRYQWSTEIGSRYFFLRKMNANKRK